MNGMVRSPRKMPPMPTVSAMVCLRPYRRGMSKSISVASCMPICTMLTTKSAPSTQARRSRCSVMVGCASNCAAVQRAIIPAVSSRSASMSCSAMVQPASAGRLRMSVSRFFTNTTLPAPMKAILVIVSPFLLPLPLGERAGVRGEARRLTGAVPYPSPVPSLKGRGEKCYFSPVLAIPWIRKRWNARKIASIGARAQQRHRHHLAPDGVHLAPQQVEPERQGVVRLVGEHHQRPGEVVPAPHESEDHEHRDDRLGQRQYDAEEDAQLAGAIEPGGLDQFVGDAHHELPHHEDAERLGGAGQDHAPGRVEQAEPGDDQEFRHQDHLDRHHQRAEDHEEQHVAAPKSELGEGVAAQQVDEHGEHHGDDCDEGRVPRPLQHAGAAEHVGEVFPGNLSGKQADQRREQLLPRAHGACRHPVDREHHHERAGGHRKPDCAVGAAASVADGIAHSTLSDWRLARHCSTVNSRISAYSTTPMALA